MNTLTTRNKFLTICLFFILFSFTLAIPAYAEEESTTNDPYVNKDEKQKLTTRIDLDNNLGAFVYSQPIEIPEGRNDLQPDLKLNYNNQDKDNLNQFGFGWSINIPEIKRINKTGTENLYSENYFTSTLSGDLKLVTSTDGIHGEYAPEVESGDFLKYEFTTGNYWQVTDKTGVVYRFGYSAASRQDNPSDSNQIYKWMLDETRDTNDNYIKYEYYKNSGQIYPDKIKYTGHNTTDGIFEIEFIRESRSDNVESNSLGFQLTNNYRIDYIQVKINGTWVKKYDLSYINGYNGITAYLESILESNRDSNGYVTELPINSYSYENLDRNWTLDENFTLPIYFVDSLDRDTGYRIGDFNGDGLYDMVRSRCSTTITEHVYIHNGSGWDLDSNLDFPVCTIGNNYNDTGVRIVDVNGDSLDDVVRADNGSRTIYMNNGYGWDTSI